MGVRGRGSPRGRGQARGESTGGGGRTSRWGWLEAEDRVGVVTDGGGRVGVVTGGGPNQGRANNIEGEERAGRTGVITGSWCSNRGSG